MTAPAICVKCGASAARRRLLARIKALRECPDITGGGCQIRFSRAGVAFFSVPDKTPTHSVDSWLEPDCGRPGARNERFACRAEMGAPGRLVESDAQALGRRLAQFRAQRETVYEAGRIRQTSSGCRVACLAKHGECAGCGADCGFAVTCCSRGSCWGCGSTIAC